MRFADNCIPRPDTPSLGRFPTQSVTITLKRQHRPKILLTQGYEVDKAHPRGAQHLFVHTGSRAVSRLVRNLYTGSGAVSHDQLEAQTHFSDPAHSLSSASSWLSLSALSLVAILHSSE